MIDELKKIINKLNGNLVMIYVSEPSIVNCAQHNKKITNLVDLSDIKFKKEKGSKNIKVKEIKKELSFDINYVLCNTDELYLNYNKFIKESYYLCNKELIYYGKYDEYDVDRLINKYSRYGIKLTKNIYSDGYIIRIDMRKIKINFFKRIIYSFIDFFSNILNLIGNGLMQ